MASNYPPGVTDVDIDEHFGPDEPELEEVITPRDILSRLINETGGEGRAHLLSALEILWRERRIDSANGLPLPSRLAWIVPAVVDTREELEGR